MKAKSVTLVRKSVISALTFTALVTMFPVSAATYTLDTPWIAGNYPIDLQHISSGSASMTRVDFGRTFDSPLASIRFEVSGHVIFPEVINNTTGEILKAPVNATLEMGPSVNSLHVGTNSNLDPDSSSYSMADNSLSNYFVVDTSGNFRLSYIFNNTGSSQGAPFFSAFNNGGALGFALGYDDFGAFMNNQTFSQAGWVTLSSAQLSVSTDQFLLPTPVPEPSQAVLMLSGLALLMPSVVRRRKASLL